MLDEWYMDVMSYPCFKEYFEELYIIIIYILNNIEDVHSAGIVK